MGLETILKFETPVAVSYKTLNLIPFKNLQDSKIVHTGEYISEPGVGKKEIIQVEANANMLLVRTAITHSWVIRVEQYEPGKLVENPSSMIESLPFIKSVDNESASKAHRQIVDELKKKYQLHLPTVVYDGPLIYSC